MLPMTTMQFSVMGIIECAGERIWFMCIVKDTNREAEKMRKFRGGRIHGICVSHSRRQRKNLKRFLCG